MLNELPSVYRLEAYTLEMRKNISMSEDSSDPFLVEGPSRGVHGMMPDPFRLR